MTYKHTIVLDFDGVVHSYTSGWKGVDVVPDPIVEGAIAFILGALAAGYRVAIHSSRSNTHEGRRAMRNWLYIEAGDTWNDSPDGPGLCDVEFPEHKPAALVSIDDRAITFTGTFPSLDTIKNFKPWNKK
jgi:hypothetical protein